MSLYLHDCFPCLRIGLTFSSIHIVLMLIHLWMSCMLIEETENSTLFLAGLPAEASEAMLQMLFSQYEGFKGVFEHSRCHAL